MSRQQVNIMHSFIISSKNKNLALEEINKIYKERKIDKFDVNFLESEKQIGIPDIRNFQKNAYLKPFKSKEKLLVLLAINGITTEAQNALLKILEEPPLNTIIIMAVESTELILPTVLSRCEIIELKEKKEINEKENLILLESIKKAGIGERLKIAEKLSKDKENILFILDELIQMLRKNLINDPNEENIKKIKAFQKTYTIIKSTNVNQRLAIENLLLNL